MFVEGDMEYEEEWSAEHLYEISLKKKFLGGRCNKQEEEGDGTAWGVTSKLERKIKLWILLTLSSTVLDRSALLGKVLRVDIDDNDNGPPYSIPSDNPFMWEKGTRPGKSLKIF